jgi:DNA-binding PadR family transcriptional regulator
MSPRRGLPRRESNPANLLPLTPLAFSILLALADQKLHGYGIAQRIGERDTGGIALAPGNLYAALDRLIDAGLVERVAPATDASDSRRGRQYRITGFGRNVAGLEAARLRAVVRTAQRLNLMPTKTDGA